MATILLVDDEVSLLHSMELKLSRAGHECTTAETLECARGELKRIDPDLAIVDIRLPDGNGLDLVGEVRKEGHTFPIIVLTAFGSIPNAVSAMRDGANDYVEKPIDLDQLTFIVERNLETQRLKGRIEFYERTRPRQDSSPDLVGESEAFRSVLDMAQRVANPGVIVPAEMPTVLITGETGTGKDVVARHIHAIGPMASQPFVHVDCASLPRELIESELFGHERGAFTDAKSSKRGLLEIAAEGTVFLNEVGELPMDLQAKLLTCLERRVFRRVGGTRDVQLRARIIAATNADLAKRVEEKQFREDLFYRLNVFAIKLPPLRDRGRDANLLAEFFHKNLCRKYHRSTSGELSAQVHKVISEYRWPGNVRELSHLLERACLLAGDGTIQAEHLGLGLPSSANTSSSDKDLPSCSLGEMERMMIEQAMATTGGNVSQAARVLGITRGALRRRLESIAKDSAAD